MQAERSEAGALLWRAACFWAAAAPGLAQTSNKAAPAVVSHFHLNVTSIDAHKKFWVDTLGGTASKLYGLDVVQFPDIYIFLRQQAPTGPTRGTAFDHIGFAVPDVPALTTKVVAAGYQLTPAASPRRDRRPRRPPARKRRTAGSRICWGPTARRWSW